MSRPYLLFLILLVITGLILLLGQGTILPEVNESGDMSIVHSIGWLALLGSSLLLGMRHKPKEALRYTIMWLVIGATIAAIYHVFGPF